MTPYRRKLIEVDLPLDAINAESAREKSGAKPGHPATLHPWWARRPLAACRAVIFASLVDDPSSCPEEFPTEEAQRVERDRLHGIITRLVRWESTDESRPEARHLLAQARYEIARSVARARGETAPTDPADVLRYLRDEAKPIYDPFCGGGSIPLEAQRLGLRAMGSDLNPVAVLITKALIELPPKFRDQPPVNPEANRAGMTVGKGRKQRHVPWRGTAGLANDIRYYGRWMRDEAFRRIGHLYPKAKLPDGSEATVIAWLWARTIPCPNPACGVRMPLMKTFQLSKKKGNEHWTRPVVDRDSNTISFVVQDNNGGVPKGGTVSKKGAICIACNSAVKLDYVRKQAKAGNMGEQMTAIVAEGDRRRLFFPPTDEHIRVALHATPTWRPSGSLPDQARSISVQIYGFTDWSHLFTERQLTALTTFSDLLSEVHNEVEQLEETNDRYSNAINMYLALTISGIANGGSNFTRWLNDLLAIARVFSRQGIPMIWDFAEANPFSTSTQNWMAQVDWVASVLERVPGDANDGKVYQADAATMIRAKRGPVIVTDPPYYDNIHYADSSDFFYVWLRPLLRDSFPELFASILAPKNEEIVANRFRFKNHRERFEILLSRALKLIRERCSDEFPSSVFYAYKQHQEKREGRTSTGWESMLNAMVTAGFQIVGTWPVRTERSARSNALQTNALASSVVLVCRPRSNDAPAATRRQFLEELGRELPDALDRLTHDGHIAPVDLAQAAIGPGMQIYSRYGHVETISGEQVTVREALAAINQAIAEYYERQEGELDAASRFCFDWLQEHGFSQGKFGDAEVLSQAKNVAVSDLASNRLLTAAGGVVRLLPLDEYSSDRPMRLEEMTAWEGCFRMAWHMNREYGGGTVGAADVARRMGGAAERVERLARILYNHYDRKGDSANAVIFNNLVTSWQDIVRQAQEPPPDRLF
ncbi:MAG: DUF1156 domain-containing protein [Chloroflexi bacterium]|nr:DUF1156 domain-containing protein [Chloroflexota bacterium]MCY3938337.1 DUF1156 domain-containing protein [Chloroflexota bacterium]